MRDLNDLNPDALLSITQATKHFFNKEKAGSYEYDVFAEIPHYEMQNRKMWQVKDIDKYLERHKL